MGIAVVRSAPNAVFDGVLRALRSTARNPLPEVIRPNHSFVLDLGFDSMTIALLSVALEDEFDCAILLDGWICEHRSPDAMTVASLCHYLEGVLDGSAD